MDAKPRVDTRTAARVLGAAAALAMATPPSIASIATRSLAAEAPKAPETPAAAPPATNAPEESSKLQHLAPAEAASVLGRPVRGPDGHDIGRTVDVLVDQAGHPRAAVIDFGGFMGVGSRKIAVDWHLLHFTPGDPDKPITLELTPDQIKAAPEYKPGSNPTVVTAAPGKGGVVQGAPPPAQTVPPVPAATDKQSAAPNHEPDSGTAGPGAPAPHAASH